MSADRDRLWADSMPEAYDRALGEPVFHPFAADLAQRAARLVPRRVLELAAGTGVVTRELTRAAPSAAVTATDLNEAMVEWGARCTPAASWETADAQRLPHPDASFDLVVCQFGVMFFPDRAAAFGEARRVLEPHGRLLFNTWGPLHAHDFQQALVTALGRLFPDDPPRFMTGIPHGYSDAQRIHADLRASGFTDIDVRTVTLTGTAPSIRELAAGYCTGTPLRAEIDARGDVGATTRRVGELMAAELGEGPVTGRMTAHVAEAGR